jgi:hypothetical protein
VTVAFSLCNHLTSTTVDCSTSPPAGTPCACICKNAAGTAVRPRIRNLHDGTHGRLVKDGGTPPSGFLAVYDFVHDTTGTQGTPCVVDGDYVAWPGGTAKIRIRYQGAGGPTNFDLQDDTPSTC